MATTQEVYKKLVEKNKGLFVCQKKKKIVVIADPNNAAELLDSDCLTATMQCGGCVREGCQINELYVLAHGALNELYSDE